MNARTSRFAAQYLEALREHVQAGLRASLELAGRLGRQAVALGLETLDLARIHKLALAGLELPGEISRARKGKSERAKRFFAEAITPIEHTHPAARQAKARLARLRQALRRRTMDLAASNQQLKEKIAGRKAAEKAFRQSAQHDGQLLAESRGLQEDLRQLAHRILSAQEAQRQWISRELHDQIEQALLGINVRLVALRQGGRPSAAALSKEIASTRRLVVASVRTMNRFDRKYGFPHET